jgi:AraC-like DNA-binding protein
MGRETGYDVSLGILRQMLKFAASRGFDPAAILQAGGIKPRLLADPDARIPVEDYLRVQEAAEALLADDCFGLHMGEYFEPGSYSIVGYLMSACSTIAEAFGLSDRYGRLIGNLIRAKPRIRPGAIEFVFYTAPLSPRMSRHCFDTVFSSLVRLVRELSGRPISPLAVRFQAPEPVSRAEYERIFRCPLSFGDRENALRYDLSLASLPIAQANPSLRDHFESYARRLLNQLEAPSLADDVAVALSRLIPQGKATIKTVAAEFGLSPRRLQERLAEEARPYRSILDRTREALARGYLRDGLPVAEAAFLVGFADESSFRRAFKKWTGVGPGEYRRA